MTRRDFIASTTASALGLIAKGRPIRSAIGSRIGFIENEPSSAFPYITDGLLACWDAEWNVGIGEHEDSPSTWLNLVDNGLNMLSNGDPIFYDNYIAPTSIQNLFHTDVTDLFDDSIESGSFTIECTSHMEIGTNIKLLLFGGGPIGTGISMTPSLTSSNMTFAGNVMGTISYNRGNFSSFGTFSLVSNIGQWNVKYCHSNGMDIGWWIRNFTPPVTGFDSKRFAIGYRYGFPPDSPTVNGTKFYCIRVYTRALSDNELMFNNSIDKERFGI